LCSAGFSWRGFHYIQWDGIPLDSVGYAGFSGTHCNSNSNRNSIPLNPAELHPTEFSWDGVPLDSVGWGSALFRRMEFRCIQWDGVPLNWDVEWIQDSVNEVLPGFCNRT